MSRQISLRAVETFVVAARALSLTLAARQLGLTTSAVSRRISDLEVELGVDLFHRHNRRIELTTAGVSAAPVRRATYFWASAWAALAAKVKIAAVAMAACIRIEILSIAAFLVAPRRFFRESEPLVS